MDTHTDTPQKEEAPKASNFTQKMKKIGKMLLRLLCLVYAWPYYRKCFISLFRITRAARVANARMGDPSQWVVGNTELTPAQRAKAAKYEGEGGCSTLIVQLIVVLPFNLVKALILSAPTLAILALLAAAGK